MKRIRDRKLMTEYSRRWRKKHPFAWKENYVQKHFGLSLLEFKAKLKAQRRRCGLCGKPMLLTGMTYQSPVLDHNHGTGKPREFIHRSCNIALGLFNDDPQFLLDAVAYLEKHGV